MKWITVLGLVCAGSAAFAGSPVPRPANEFTILQPSGKQTLLSSYRGKVVLMQFLYTTCGHCQATAQMYSRLQSEFGSRGLQVVGIAFNAESQEHPAIVDNFVKSLGVNFPVGTALPDTVLSYLGISLAERFVVPQIVVIDRRGAIRAQSEYSGTADLQDETYMRSFLDRLLKEQPSTSVQKRTAHPVQTAVR